MFSKILFLKNVHTSIKILRAFVFFQLSVLLGGDVIELFKLLLKW